MSAAARVVWMLGAVLALGGCRLDRVEDRLNKLEQRVAAAETCHAKMEKLRSEIAEQP